MKAGIDPVSIQPLFPDGESGYSVEVQKTIAFFRRIAYNLHERIVKAMDNTDSRTGEQRHRCENVC